MKISYKSGPGDVKVKKIVPNDSRSERWKEYYRDGMLKNREECWNGDYIASAKRVGIEIITGFSSCSCNTYRAKAYAGNECSIN